MERSWVIGLLILLALGCSSGGTATDTESQTADIDLADGSLLDSRSARDQDVDIVEDGQLVDSAPLPDEVGHEFRAGDLALLPDIPLVEVVDVGADLTPDLSDSSPADYWSDVPETPDGESGQDLPIPDMMDVADDLSLFCPEPCLEPVSQCLQSLCIDGECVEVPANEGAACDNGNLCTTDDVCTNGKCTPGSAVQCDDGDQCTMDSCDPDVGCVHEDPPNPCWPTPALVLRFPLWGAPFSQRAALDGELLYATAQGSLRVFHNPTLLEGGGQPQISRLFDYGASDVAAAPGFAYLAGSNTFLVVGMDEPQNPLVRGTLPLSLSVIELDGHTVYGAGGSTLYVIDVTDPDAPVELGSLPGIGPVTSMAVKGDVVYAVGGGTVTAVDVSDSNQPSVAKVVALGDDTYAAALAGDTLYVGGRAGGQASLWVLDVTSPKAPVLLLQDDLASLTSWGLMGLTVHGDTLLGQAWKSGTNFFVWDLTNPTTPQQIHAGNRPGSGGYDIVAADDLAWVTCGNAGLRAYDLTAPGQPGAVAVVSAALARSMSRVGDYLYFADNGPAYGVDKGILSGLKVFDVADVTNPILKANDGTSLKVPLEMKTNGTHLFISDNSGGLKIVDVSQNPLNTTPTVLGGSARNSSTLVDGKWLFVLRWPDKLETIDAANLAAPTVAATFNEPGIVHGQGQITSDGSHLFIANYNLPFRVFDIAVPTAPALIGSLELGGVANAVVERDGIAWVGMNSGEIRILDVSMPAQPTQLGTVAGPGGASVRRLEFGGDYAFVAYAGAGAGIYGLPDLVLPELLGIIPADHQILDVEFDGTHLFLLEGDNSLLAVGGF